MTYLTNSLKSKYPVGTRIIVKGSEGDEIGYGIIDDYADGENNMYDDMFHITFDDKSEGWYSQTHHLEFLERNYTFVKPNNFDEDLFKI